MVALMLITSFSKAQLTVTLTPNNVNCEGLRTGQITANVTGGVPPYLYRWSTSEQTQSISNLHGGYYALKVTDQSGNFGDAEITLTEPEEFRIVQFDATIYTNNYNTSCYSCNDGAITVAVAGGTPPYTYTWSDGSNLQNRNNLVAKDYQLVVTDAFGCQVRELNKELSKPEREDWTPNGNINNNANSFFGTKAGSSFPDIVFKTADIEGFRLKSNLDALFTGKIGIGTASPTEKFEVVGGNAKFGGDVKISTGKILFGSGNNEISFTAASNGHPNFFKIGPGGGLSPEHPCNMPNSNQWVTQVPEMIQISQYSQLGASRLMSIGFDNVNGIIDVAGNNWTGDGSPNLLMNYYCGKDIFMCTGALGGKVNIGTGAYSNNTLNVKGTSYFLGKVGIGVDPNYMTNSTFAVDGIIGARGVNLYDISVAIPDYVFEKNYKLKPLLEVEKFVKENKHLEGFPTAAEVCENGLKMDELQIKQMEKIEELYLYLIELKKQNEALQNRLQKLETKNKE